MNENKTFSILVSYFSKEFLDKEIDEVTAQIINTLEIPIIEQEEMENLENYFAETSDLKECIEKLPNIFVSDDKIEIFIDFHKKKKISGKKILPFISFFTLGFYNIEPNESYIVLFTKLLTYYHSSIPNFITAFIFKEFLIEKLEKMFSSMSISTLTVICAFINISLRNNLDAFDLLSRFLLESHKSNNVSFIENIAPILSEMVSFIVKEKNQFDISKCLKVISERFENVEPRLYLLLTQLAIHLDDNRIRDIIFRTPDLILRRTVNNYTLHEEIDFPYTNISYTELNNTLSDFLEPLNYNVDVNKLKKESELTYDDIFGKENYNLYKTMTVEAKYIKDSYKISLADSILILLSNEKRAIKYPIATFLYERFNLQITSDIFSVLLSPPVFERTASLFNCNFNDFTLFIRSKIISLSTKLNVKTFNKLFDNLMLSPLIFVECTIYMQSVISELSSKVLFSEEMYKRLFLSATKCYFLAKESEDEKIKNAFVLARFNLFIFVFLMLQSPNIPIFCFKSPYLVCLFMQAISEDSFNQIIISNIKDLLNDTEHFHTGVGFIEHALDILLLNDSMKALVNDLFDCLIEAIPVNTSIANLCERILEISCSYLDKFKDKEILSNIFTLMIYVYSFTDIDVELNFLIKFAENFVLIEEELSESTKTRLLTILSSTSSFNPNTESLIKRPCLALMLYSIFSQKNCLPCFIEHIANYLRFSFYNKIVIQDVGFDILMLDMFTHFPNDFSFKGFKIHNYSTEEELIASIPVLSMLLSTKSSGVAAERILKIICPDKDMKVSKLAQDFASIIIPFVSCIENEPGFFYPISTTQEYVHYDNIPLESFIKSSTISFWIYVDKIIQEKNNFKSEIIRCFSDNGIFLSIFIEGYTITFIIYQENRISSFVIKTQVTPQQWNFVTISFLLDNETLTINTKINNYVSQATNIIFDNMRKCSLSFRIGNSIKHFADRYELMCGILIGSVTIFKSSLTSLERNRVYKNGINENQYEKQGCLLSFPGKKVETEFKAINIPPYEGFVSGALNISDVFRNLYPIQTIVPIFRCFDFLPSTTSQLFIDILNYLYGPVTKEILPYIPCILTTQNSSVLTYPLYQRFVMLIDKCNGNEALDSLYENILFNFEIWIRASPPHLQRICQHWANTLFQSYEYFKSENFIAKTISNIRRFFYFDKTEKICSNVERDPKLNINKCVQALYRILLEHSAPLATEEDVEFIFMSAADCNDFQQKENLIHLGTEFAKGVKCSQSILKHIFSINLDKYPLLFETIIRSLYSIIGKENFIEQISVLTARINAPQSISLTPEFLKEFPLIFPLALRISLYKDDGYKETIARIINEDIIVNDEFINCVNKDKWWMFWPLVFIVQTNEITSRRIISFVCNIVNTDELDIFTIRRILNLFDILQSTTGNDVMQCKISFMSLLLGSRSSSMHNEAFETLIFYTNSSPTLKLLEDEYEKSPFFDGSKRERNHTIRSITEFFERLNEIKINVRFILYPKSSIYEQMDDFVNIVKDSFNVTDNFKQLFCNYINGSEENKMKVLNHVAVHNNSVDQMVIMKRHEILRTAKVFFNKFAEITKDVQIINRCESVFNEIFESESRRKREFDSVWRNIVHDYMHFRSIWKNEEYNKVILKKSSHSSPLFLCMRMKRECPMKKETTKVKEDIFDKSFPCVMIKLESKQPCFFSIMKNEFEIHFETKKKVIAYDQIRNILKRGETKVEFFTVSGKTILIDFAPTQASDILSKLSLSSFPNIAFFENMSPELFIRKIGLCKRWYNGLLSNFEYILLFNIFCGRSFNDPDNQPVLPGGIPFMSIINKSLESEDFDNLHAVIKGISNMMKEDIHDFLLKTFGFVDSIEYAAAKQLNDFAQSYCVSEDVWEKINMIPNEQREDTLIKTEEISPKKLIKTAMPVFPFLKAFFIDEQIVVLTETTISYCTLDKAITTMEYEGYIKNVCVVNNSSVLAFNSGTLDVTIANEKEMNTVTLPISNIGIVKSDGPFVCVSTNECSIKVFKFPNFTEPYSCIRVFFDTIITYAVSYDHNVVAVVTNDGYVNVFDICNSRLINAYFLTDKPITHIVITEVLGNIVVFSIDAVYVLSVNGIFISSSKIPYEATNVISWHGTDGIDWVAYSDRRFSIQQFDSFTPNDKILINSGSNPILDLIYMKQYNSLLWVNSNGILFINTIKENP